MNRKQDLLGLLTLAAFWSVWPCHSRGWVDPLPRGERAVCHGQGLGGVRWRIHSDGDCAGTYRTLSVRTGNGDEFAAAVINGQILIDPSSDPPRFRASQPILWDSSSHYPYGQPGTWDIEYSPGGYRWK